MPFTVENPLPGGVDGTDPVGGTMMAGGAEEEA